MRVVCSMGEWKIKEKCNENWMNESSSTGNISESLVVLLFMERESGLGEGRVI